MFKNMIYGLIKPSKIRLMSIHIKKSMLQKALNYNA
jgi:hypothetical protein